MMLRFPLGRVAVLALVVVLSACGKSTVAPDLDAGMQDATLPRGLCDNPCCLSLRGCCDLVLVNPVFKESCFQVADICDPDRCRDLLDGYIECRPFFDDGGIDPSVCPPPPEGS